MLEIKPETVVYIDGERLEHIGDIHSLGVYRNDKRFPAVYIIDTDSQAVLGIIDTRAVSTGSFLQETGVHLTVTEVD